MEYQPHVNIPGECPLNPIFLDNTPYAAPMQQPLPQPQVYPVALPVPAHVTSGQYFGHFDGQNSCQAQQAVASEQPHNKLGRPKKEKPVQEGPRRRPGRPSGGVDVRPRLKRGEKAAMSAEELKVHMAEKRVQRKLAKAARRDAEASQPPHIPAPTVPQAPTEVWNSGYESISRPSAGTLVEPSPINFGIDLRSNVDFVNSNNTFDRKADLAASARHVGLKFYDASQPLASKPELQFDTGSGVSQQAAPEPSGPVMDPFYNPLPVVGQNFSSVPAESNMGVYSQPSFDSGYSLPQQPQPLMEFNNYGQMTFNYGGQGTSGVGQDIFNMLQHPVTMPQQSVEGVAPAW